MTSSDHPFAKLVLKLARQNDLSLADVAVSANVAKSTVFLLVGQALPNPRVDTVMRIAVALGVRPSRLLSTFDL